MAEFITVEGQVFKKRSPLGVWGLVFVTFGIYGFVWYYKVNDEARRYLRDETIKPGVALLAVILGWIVIVPPFISIYRTGERILRMEEKAGVQQQISPALGLLASFVASIHMIYMQEHLNRVWSATVAAQAPTAPPIPPPPPPPPAPQV